MKLTAQKIVLFLLPFSVLLLPFSFSGCSKSSPTEPETKRPQIEVTGDITENTVWESGKDYIVHGTVVVGENATLTIEKDVHVYFDEDGNEVKGQLDVRGIINASSDDSTKRVVFQSLEYGQDIELQRGINLYNDYNQTTFNHCVFNYLSYGIQGTETRATVKNCKFGDCYYAININKCDSLLISHCEFTDNSYCIKIELSKGLTDSSLKISYNNFLNCDQIAIELNNQSSSQLTDNIYKNCNMALLCQNSSTVVLLFSNFFHCKYGVVYRWDSGGGVQENQFKEGDVFVTLDYYVDSVNINYNNFDDAQIYNIYSRYLEITINAENNWWGSADESEISTRIYDANDLPTPVDTGVIDYIPFLVEPLDEIGVL